MYMISYLVENTINVSRSKPNIDITNKISNNLYFILIIIEGKR